LWNLKSRDTLEEFTVDKLWMCVWTSYLCVGSSTTARSLNSPQIYRVFWHILTADSYCWLLAKDPTGVDTTKNWERFNTGILYISKWWETVWHFVNIFSPLIRLWLHSLSFITFKIVVMEISSAIS
jgi:hypothetical protein